MDLLKSVLTSSVVVDALATLAALLLAALTALVVRYLKKVGIEIDAQERAALEAKVAEGILAMEQIAKVTPSAAATNTQKHQGVVDYVLDNGGKAAAKVARPVLNNMIHAGVRRLKSIL